MPYSRTAAIRSGAMTVEVLASLMKMGWRVVSTLPTADELSALRLSAWDVGSKK
jgi:hypothetical protein